MKIDKEKLKAGLKFIGTVIIPILTLAIDSTLKYMENKNKEQ